MRELCVYYCPSCGHYGYYQLPKNATCPKCDAMMNLLDMKYQDFMDLDCKERDGLISRLILEASPSYVQRIVAPHEASNYRETIASLSKRIVELETENKKLNSTVHWMHGSIWDLFRENKKLKQALQEQEQKPPDNPKSP